MNERYLFIKEVNVLGYNNSENNSDKVLLLWKAATKSL